MADISRAPVERALHILEAMNGAPVVPIREIASATGLPKSSVVRLLGQLAAAGYVEKLSRNAGYRLTARVRRLSWGFRLDDVVVEAASPLMRGFTRVHRWPVFIGTADGDQMIVRYGTVAESPVAVDPLVYEAPSPFLMSAIGKAYLAFCPDWERDAIIARLAQSHRSIDRLAQDPGDLRRMLREIRKAGYAITGEDLRHMTEGLSAAAGDALKRATGLAVPVLSTDRVIACLSLRFMRSVMTDGGAADAYLEPLRQLAEEIANAARQRSNPEQN